MSSDNSIAVWLNGREYEVEDAGSMESWMSGLEEFILEYAEVNYATEFDSLNENYEVTKESQRKIAEHISSAIVQFRKKSVEGTLEGDTWKNYVEDALYEALGIRDVYGYECAQEIAFSNSSFRRVEDSLEEAFEDHEGDLVELEDLTTELSSKIVEKMQELDDSTVFDSYGKPLIKFVYIPGMVSGKSHIDDHVVHLDNLKDLDPTSYGFDSLIKLFRVDHIELMNSLEVDHTDTKAIDKWLSYDAPVTGLEPLLEIGDEDEKDTLIYVLENSGVRYGTPCWIGMLSINEILALDPLKPIELRGGSVGINDESNGAGFMVDLPDDKVIRIPGNEVIIREYGYEMDCERAKINNESEAPVKKRKSLSLDGPCF